MRARNIPLTDIELSEWSLGCSGIGGRVQLYGINFGWPEVSDDELLAAIKAGLDLGITHFDVADLYGLGNSERRLAWALNKLGVPSEHLVISSKVGWMRGTAEHAYDPWHMRRQCEQSLRNLQRDYLDIYYLHHGNFGEEDQWLHPAAEALNGLQKDGLIRVKGQSAYSVADFEKSIPVVQPQVLQSRGNLLDTAFIDPASSFSALLTKEKLGFVAFSPVGAGLLTDRFDPESPPEFKDGESRKGNERFEAPYLRQLRPVLESVRKRFGASKEDLAGIAMRYVLDQPNVISVLNGFQRRSDILSSQSVLGCELSEEDHRWLEQAFADLRTTKG